MVQPRVLIISPVRNEVAHIERVVAAVAAQELAPAAWIVVDDGSDDGTLDLLRALEPSVPFLQVLAAPAHDGPPPRDRLARAAAPRTFNRGLDRIDAASFSHVMKLDGDIELPPAYLRRLMERFAADPRLGIACGDLVEPQADGTSRRIPIPPHHVHGALKCYGRTCFAAIGGIQERLGWDTIDETYARMHGFTTRSFPDLVAVHLRPLGSADGTLRGRARHGECAWIAHFGLLWVSLRAVKIARSRPLGLSGLAFLFGYLRAGASRIQRVPDREFRRFARRELRMRMVRALAPGALARAGRGSG